MKKKGVKGAVLGKKKEGFSLCKEYKEAFYFIKDSRNFIYVAILLFGIFLVMGFFFQDLINSLFSVIFEIDLNKEILDYVEKILRETEGMGYGEFLGYIFFRNLQSSFLGMLLGIVLGIFPIAALIANGYLLGFVALVSVKANGIWVLWRILPHGIFELPAVFISLGLGIRLGTYIFHHKPNESFTEIFLNSIRVFLLVVFPLLVIAAIIEAGLIVFFG